MVWKRVIFIYLFPELQSFMIFWKKFLGSKGNWFFLLQFLFNKKFVIEYPKIDRESASSSGPEQSISQKQSIRLKYLQLKNFLVWKSRVESTTELIMGNDIIKDCAKKSMNLYDFFCIIDKSNSWHFTQKLSLLSLKIHATYI